MKPDYCRLEDLVFQRGNGSTDSSRVLTTICTNSSAKTVNVSAYKKFWGRKSPKCFPTWVFAKWLADPEWGGHGEAS